MSQPPRPGISVVMPFAGDRLQADAAIRTLTSLRTQPGDELILVDNSSVMLAALGITIVRATGERSPAHARNAGAQRATGEWILFLDADCRAPSDLLDAYFALPVADDLGALAGEVVAAPDAQTLAARYGADRSFLSQQAHLEHPFRPRAVAANLLVRRAAFEQVGGFYEGIRAAEDTDFSWRLQQAGWRLELRASAAVEHHYRTSLRELRRQWRGYAAGRAWLSRRYEGFTPRPALWRALSRATRGERRAPAQGTADGGRLRRGQYMAIDALLSAEELAGFALSNRPARGKRAMAGVVLVVERFPARGDPLAEFARTLEGARVEAVARPDAVDVEAARELDIEYREDDGVAARLAGTIGLVLRHPVRSTADVLRRRTGEPPLSALAPAVRRLERDRAARVLALGGESSRAAAERMAHLAGRTLEEPRRHQGIVAALAQHGRRR